MDEKFDKELSEFIPYYKTELPQSTIVHLKGIFIMKNDAKDLNNRKIFQHNWYYAISQLQKMFGIDMDKLDTQDGLVKVKTFNRF